MPVTTWPTPSRATPPGASPTTSTPTTPAADSGFFTRVGIRPNEGTMDVGMSLWLPGGELGEYRWVKEQREMVDSVLEVGAVRYEMLEALQSWRLTMDGEVQARPCVRGETTTAPGPGGARRALRRRHPRHRHRRAAERRAQVGRGGRRGRHGGQGPPGAGGPLDGHAHRRRHAPRVARRARQPRPLLGPAALGRPEDVALVLHQHRRGHALRRHPPRHRRRRPAPRLGVGRRRGPRRWPSGACGPSWPTTA